MRRIRPVIAAVAGTIAAIALAPVASARPQPVIGAHGAAVARHASTPEVHPEGARHPGPGPTVPLRSSPQIVRIDRATRTAYVTSDQGTISLVDIARCNVERHSRCARPVAALPGPGDALDIAVNDGTKTLYLTSGVNDADAIVSVYDVAHCTAKDASGCGPAIATVHVGGIPIGLALSAGTGTLYVGNVSNRVDVLDIRSCRRGLVWGCAHARVGSVHGNNTGLVVLDAAHRTLYATENGQNQDGTDVLVIDTRHCRASDASRCGAAPARLPTGPGPTLALLAGHTLFVANQGDSTVSVLDVAHCTGADHSGCRQQPTNVPVGANPSGGLVRSEDGDLYVGNSDSDTLSTFNTRSCRAGHTAGCPTSPPRTLRTGQQPFWAEYDPVSETIFVTNHVDGTLGVMDPERCGAEHRRGCRHLLPAISGGNALQIADQAVHTWYGADGNGNLTLTDTRVCTARQARSCLAATVHTSQPAVGFFLPVVDESTHSLFLPRIDFATNTNSLAVIDTRTCNATIHTTCAPVTAPMWLPNYLAVLAINKRTHTLYASLQVHNVLAVIDAVHCNAMVQTACSVPVAEVKLPDISFGVSTDPVTNSVYVTEFGQNFDKSTVFIVDGRHCRATDVSGCSRTPRQFMPGLAPLGVVVDDAMHSLYVLDNGGGDVSGDVSVFDSRTCNARVTAGCAHPAARFMVGRAPFRAALDPVTQHLFVGDFEHAALTEIDARACNATRVRGCRDAELDTGDSPSVLAIDAATHSLFAFDALHGESAHLDTRRSPGR